MFHFALLYYIQFSFTVMVSYRLWFIGTVVGVGCSKGQVSIKFHLLFKRLLLLSIGAEQYSFLLCLVFWFCLFIKFLFSAGLLFFCLFVISVLWLVLRYLMFIEIRFHRLFSVGTVFEVGASAFEVMPEAILFIRSSKTRS